MAASRDAGARPVTIIVAVTVNATIAIAKMAVGALTGSSAIIAEGWHAVADTGNESVLWLAQHRASVPADAKHPLGHGREAYFWALIAAVGVFVTGGLLSLRQGIQELVDPEPVTHFGAAYAVLAISLVLEGTSLAQASRQLRAESRWRRRPLLEYVLRSSEPTTRAVFAEDVAAVIGNLVALAGVGLHQLTGSAVPDAVASLLIGILLGVVGIALAERNRDFLIGEPVPPSIHRAIEAALAAQPGIEDVDDLLVAFSGPRRAWVLAHVSVDRDLTAGALAEVLAHAADRVADADPVVDRVDLVPSVAGARAETAGGTSGPGRRVAGGPR